MKTDVLPEKYRQAISLIEDGSYSYKDIAANCGISEESLYDLIEGTKSNNANIQALFTAELDKVYKNMDKETKKLIKKNRKSIQILMDRWLCMATKRKLDSSLMSTLTSVANAISKSTPNVEIGSFTYQKGLSPEDIYAEFRRLNGLASDRGAISGSSSGRTGEIPVASGSGTPVTEE
jgi:predicted DNA-binding protein YlxM (UPF0122 family)